MREIEGQGRPAGQIERAGHLLAIRAPQHLVDRRTHRLQVPHGWLFMEGLQSVGRARRRLPQRHHVLHGDLVDIVSSSSQNAACGVDPGESPP